ncbi:MAG: hypothetical protein BMS9Abin01_0292 [Gammaproteobacteria bacterium]|nr:MAG: hypothetical protein BMS9Abin01_0292 [Gammaproteobacteria bacterium]
MADCIDGIQKRAELAALAAEQCWHEFVQMRDHNALATAFVKATGRFDLRPHAAGLEMSLLLQSPQFMAVRAEVRRIIYCLGHGGGLVLNSVHNIQNDVPVENIVALFDEARTYPMRAS